MASVLLIGDIGGTNARFALADPEQPGFSAAETLLCADYPSVEAAIAQYLGNHDVGGADVICLATAGPLIGESINVTNNHWHIVPQELSTEFGTRQVKLVNDFAAIAYSIPFLGRGGYTPIGLPEGGELPADFNVAICGPGTGLGTAGLCRRNGQLIPISGEGGHIGFAPESRVQMEILRVLHDRFERVSAERLLSGSGLQNIYRALCEIHGDKRKPLEPADIFANVHEDSRASESVAMFFDVMGQVAGDLALVLDARDGVFIGGGITRRYPDLLANSGFRNAFENKGRHRGLMERIPTHLITHDEPGLLGAAYCALELSSDESS